MTKYIQMLIIINIFSSFYSCSNIPCITSTGIIAYNVVDEIAVPLIGIDSLCKTIKYPENAKRVYVDGTVIIEFTVNKDGDVVNEKPPLPNAAAIIRGIGAGCDEVIINTIINTKFIPAKKNGKPVFSRMKMPFNFYINCENQSISVKKSK